MSNYPRSISTRLNSAILVTIAMLAGLPIAAAQDAADRVKIGYQIDVPVPLETAAANRLLDQLTRLGQSAPEDERVTVVLRYPQDIESGEETQFEDALKLARAMTGPELRRVRIVSLVQGEVSGHSTLPIISSDLLIVSNTGVISNASAGEATADKTIELSYAAIAELRGLFPPAIVSALVDPGLELAQVSKVGGGQVFAAGEQLDDLRKSGNVLGEDVWSPPGVPLRLESKQLRSARIAAAVVDSLDQAAEFLDLAELNPISEGLDSGEANGILLEITGSIVAGRTRRWQSNLTSTLESGDVNTWVITIDMDPVMRGHHRDAVNHLELLVDIVQLGPQGIHVAEIPGY